MLPSWIPFLVAVWVIAFGVMRIRIGMQKNLGEDEERPNYRKGGYYKRSGRSHIIYGVAYLALGGYAVAMGFGYQYDFIGSCQAPQKTESPDSQPMKDGVRVDLTPATTPKP